MDPTVQQWKSQGQLSVKRRVEVNQVKGRMKTFLTAEKHDQRVRLWGNTNGTSLLDLLSVRQEMERAKVVHIGRSQITEVSTAGSTYKQSDCIEISS